MANIEDLKRDIFYRPDVDIERDYSTTGTIERTTPEPVEPEKITPPQRLMEKADKVIDSLLRARGVLPLMPNDTVKEILERIIDNLVFQTEDEKDKIEDLIEEEEENEENRTDVYEDGSNSEPGYGYQDEPVVIDENFVYGNPPPQNLTIKIIKTKTAGELASDQYLKDSLEIKEDFASELNSALQDYVYPLLTIMNEAGVDRAEYLNMPYDGRAVSGYSSNENHLNDLIVRNQTVMGEITRLFNKTHSANAMGAMLTAFDVVAQERIKYYTENYSLAVTSFLDMYKRDTLEKTRKEYDYKYLKTKTNVYKFLNSSVKVTEDLLKLALDSNTAKCYLLNKNINIFNRTEYAAVQVENSVGNGAAEVDPSASSSNSNATTTVSKATDNSTNSTQNNSASSSLSSAADDLKNSVAGAVNSISGLFK